MALEKDSSCYIQLYKLTETEMFTARELSAWINLHFQDFTGLNSE